MPPDKHGGAYTALGQHQRWLPGFARQMPYFGSAALILAVLGALTSAAILAVSDGKEVNTCRYQPTIYISIASMLTNFTVQYALTQGIAIAWWRKALTSGTEIGDLRRTHDYSCSF